MSVEIAPSQFTVAILPLGEISDWHISLTSHVLEKEFKIKTTVLQPAKIPQNIFNPTTGRYKGQELAEFLFFLLPNNAQRIVAIVAGELEDEKNQPCLGCANAFSRVAACTISNKWWAQSDEKKNNHDMVYYRVAVHEFGHTLGIYHCKNDGCAMSVDDFSTSLCDGCRRWANRELKVVPGSPEERFSLAENFFVRDCFREAASRYREAISLAPHEPLYHFRLSISLLKADQIQEADKHMHLALNLCGGDYGAGYSLGLMDIMTNLKEAERSFARAINLTADKKLIHRLIGQAYREIAHDIERASHHYLEYLRLGGDDPDVIEWLKSRSKLE